jgi:hypothetical protein
MHQQQAFSCSNIMMRYCLTIWKKQWHAMNTTHIDWSTAGYNNWLQVAKPDERFLVEINARAKVLYKDFADACDYNANVMYDQWEHKPFYVMLSGGLDSECVASTFHRLNIPFTPLIVDLGEMNRYERWYAEYWCFKNKVTPHVLKLEPEDIRIKIFKRYLKELPLHTYQYNSLICLFIADYITDLGGCVVTGLADPAWDLNNQEFYWNYVDFPLDIHRNQKHPTSFYAYTPEIALSYVYNFDTILDEQYSKIGIYGVGPRPKYNYLSEFAKTDVLEKIMNARHKKIKNNVRYYIGSKDDIINKLSPK